MKTKSTVEREQYLSRHIDDVGGYCIVTYGEVTELLYFSKHKNDIGSDSDWWYLEAPNSVRRIKMDYRDLKTSRQKKKMMRDYRNSGYIIREDGYAYEIDTPQVSPFLPEEVEIEFLTSEEEVALEWLLIYEYAEYDWKN